MLRQLALLAAGTASIILTGCSTTTTAPDSGYGAGGAARLYDGMGPHKRRITTDSPEAQAYFDQGLNWLYAFNHDEAVRSFTKAAEIDPGCAMAWWGVSYAQGPNYNDPMMSPGRSLAAWDALQHAIRALDDERSSEIALIRALESRYANPWPDDRTELNAAFADAMEILWNSYPDDSDIGTMYAESLMVQTPWRLYSDEQEPIESVPEILGTLERVMSMDPENPGANHLYIHAIEPSANPDRAIPAADRLSDLVPAAGHLEHMPSHIYVQVGMWNEAVIQNAKAMAADAEYRALSSEQFIQHLYMAHNSHMLAFAAMMTGREQEAINATRSMWEDIPADELPVVAPIVDAWMCARYDVKKRFGRWEEILAEPAPPEYMPVTTATWRAARAVALAALHDFDGARAEHEAFRAAKQAIPEDAMWGPDKTHTVLEVAEHFIAGEIELQQGDLDAAASHLEKSVEIEDTLAYGEPPNWLQPVRHTLGAVYLAQDRFGDAERVYREDLEKWRENGWSLYGLASALEGQGRDQDAASVMARYEQVWRYAEEPTTTSCKCIVDP